MKQLGSHLVDARVEDPALPVGLGAEVLEGSWPVPPVFDLVGETAGASKDDLRATFNMGIGMVLVVPAERVGEAVERAGVSGVAAFGIGRVEPGAGIRYR